MNVNTNIVRESVVDQEKALVHLVKDNSEIMLVVKCLVRFCGGVFSLFLLLLLRIHKRNCVTLMY